MNVVILAAGEGTRLRPLTERVPKCMVPLAGRPLLARQLDALDRAGLDRVTLVVGYRADVVRDAFPGRAFRDNPDYATTNMVHSLMCARDILTAGDDVLVAYSDIVYEPGVVRALAAAPSAPMRIASNRAWERCWGARLARPLDDAETFKVDPDGRVLELGRKAIDPADVQGQYMGLFVLRADVAAGLPARYDAWSDGDRFEGRPKRAMFMTALLQHLIDEGVDARAVPVDGGWLEVDTTEDLAVYERLHAAGELDAICRLDDAP